MGKSKRVVTLKTPCVCGRLGAIWSGDKLFCSYLYCGCLIREKGKDRISGSLPIVVPNINEGSSWKPISSVQQVRSIDPNRWPIALDKHELAALLFERYGCGNGLICDDDSCTLC